MMFNFVSDERFRKPVTTTELEEFGRSWSSDKFGRVIESISCGSFEYCNRVENVVAGIS